MTFLTRRCQNTDAAISNVVVSRQRRTLKTFKKRPPPLCTRLRSTALKKSVEAAEKEDDDARKPQPDSEAWEYKYLYDGACPVCRSLKAGLEGTTECGKSSHSSCVFDRTKARGGSSVVFSPPSLSLSLSLCVCASRVLTKRLLFSSFLSNRYGQRQRQDLLREHRGPSLRRFEAPKRDVRRSDGYSTRFEARRRRAFERFTSY